MMKWLDLILGRNSKEDTLFIILGPEVIISTCDAQTEQNIIGFECYETK
jgi:hypothetical protein